MKSWETKKLGDVCELYQPKTISSKEMVDDGNYPVFGANGIIGKYDKYNHEEPQLLITCRGATCGSINISEPKSWINGNAMVVRPKDNSLSLKFIEYLFLGGIDISKTITGAAQPQITRQSLSPVLISYPNSIQEQQRIVTILDEAFAAIAKAKANAEQNLKNAKELFDSYIEGLFLNLFQTKETKTISELAKVIGGFSFKSVDFKKEGKYQVIRMGNVRHGVIRENESPIFIDTIDDKVLTKALLLPNDVIITQTGTKNKRDYGFTVIIEKNNYLLNQRIASIRFSDKYLPKFFLYYSWTNVFRDQYFENETGTVGQGNVGISAITEAEVPFIPVMEQQLIVDKIDELITETQKLETIYHQKINDLEELKKSVLQKAFSGELKTEKVLV